MEGHWIYIICPMCKGVGEMLKREGAGENEYITCPRCNGQKLYLWGYMTKDDWTLPPEIPEEE